MVYGPYSPEKQKLIPVISIKGSENLGLMIEIRE
jgi:hypothetical protein